MLEGDWEPSPAVRFHAGFYKARPDVNSVIHTHSHYVSVFATTRRTIGMYNVVSVLFYEDQALYEDDGTHPPVDPDLMCAALGDRRVLLIKNHGAIIASQSLENATIEACMLEVAAEYHIEAEAIGGSEFPEVEARRGARSVPQVLPAADVGRELPPAAQDRSRPLRVRRLMSDATACGGLTVDRLQPGHGRPDGDDDPRRPRRRRGEGRVAPR